MTETSSSDSSDLWNTSNIFGSWLRQKRKALDLTRQELAHLASCAVITIEKIEMGQRRPSKVTAQALATALEIPNHEHAAFIAFARGRGAPVFQALPQSQLNTQAPFAPIIHNLPPVLPPLIGRDDDLDRVQAQVLYGDSRLTVLTGLGGVGKTNLALHVAARCAQRVDLFKDGVVFVDLAPLQVPTRVITTIVQTVASLTGNYSTDLSLSMLQDQLLELRMFLVLDSFEQVLPAAAQVEALLRSCPMLRILITSRDRLPTVGSVHSIAISPLPLDAAITLFFVRAQAVHPTFSLTFDNRGAVKEICRVLGGLPLAIELVAARTKLMTPQMLLSRLVDSHDQLRLDLVADGISQMPERQRTMRATIDWSYRLLSTEEQTAFRRLAVFVGGFDLAAGEQVIRAKEAWPVAPMASALPLEIIPTWNTLTLLLNKSLILRSETAGGEPRFVIQELLRQFALEMLQSKDAQEALQTYQQHASFFAALALEAEPYLSSPQPAMWFARLEQDHANLRSALSWLLVHDPILALRMSSALGAFWFMHGHLQEGQQWLEGALREIKVTELEGRGRVAHAHALFWLSRITRRSSQWAKALTYAEQSVTLFRTLGDRLHLAQALGVWGWAGYSMMGCETAIARFEESLDLYRTLGDQRGIAKALLDLGHMACQHEDDLEKAMRFFGESRITFRELGEDEGIAHTSLGFSVVHYLSGHYDAYVDRVLEAIEYFEHAGAKTYVAQCYVELGEVHYVRGDWSQAHICLERAQTLLRQLGEYGNQARVHFTLGRLSRQEGNLASAMAFFTRALSSFRALQRDMWEARCIAALGGLALLRGQVSEAVTLISATRRYDASHKPLYSRTEKEEEEHDLTMCRVTLDQRAFDAAWAQGQMLTLAEAGEQALVL